MPTVAAAENFLLDAADTQPSATPRNQREKKRSAKML
jgi:hypothetical protein